MLGDRLRLANGDGIEQLEIRFREARTLLRIHAKSLRFPGWGLACRFRGLQVFRRCILRVNRAHGEVASVVQQGPHLLADLAEFAVHAHAIWLQVVIGVPLRHPLDEPLS